MAQHERFQTHCRYCFKQVEADSAVAAISKAEEHERSGKCPARPQDKTTPQPQ